MKKIHSSLLAELSAELLGGPRWEQLAATLALPADVLVPRSAARRLGASELAMALAIGLFDRLCEAVPLAAAYAAECRLSGRRLVFDHGAMRTVATASGALPAGRQAVARILEPLGYRQSLVYPLPRLGMTGYVYTHAELAEELPQYFVSELEPERFSPRFRATVEGLLATSTDPLTPESRALLHELQDTGALDYADALRLLPALLRSFARQHREATLDEYETLAAESAEMAWIATEGHTFNHITDRVEDVHAVASQQRALGRPIKAVVEKSASGRVLQTALQAHPVDRLLRDGDRFVARRVPGSFLEFISRARLSDAPEAPQLDLAFDSANAQGIFKMTDAGAA